MKKLFFQSISAIFILSCGFAQTSLVWADYFVSTDGNDANSGTLTSPFATLKKAQEAVRTINKSMTGDIVVYFREGTYFINETINLKKEDGGNNGYNVFYRSYNGEKVTLSGGRLITGWSGSNGVYTASSGGKVYRQLFVNDKPAVKAEGGSGGSAVEQIWEIHGHWSYAYLPQTPSGQVVSRAAANFAALNLRHGYFQVGTRNSPSAVTSPGQFATDQEKIYYFPRTGEDMNKVEAVVPVADPLFNIAGASLDEMTSSIIFQELAFAHTTWTGFDTAGLCDIQAGIAYFSGREGTGEDTAWLERASGGIVVENARNIRFEKCEFKCMGGGSIFFKIACHSCAVIGSTFRDIGANGIDMGQVSSYNSPPPSHDDGTFNPTDKRLWVDSLEVSNNLVYDVGSEFKGCVGIFAGYVTNLSLRHNEVRDLPYTGISEGWGWTTDTNHTMRNNRMTGNLVTDCMRELVDGALFYTLCGQPGSVIDSNVLIYSGKYQVGGNFFYMDGGSSYFTVKRNVTIGCSYTFGMGNGASNMIIDSNWAEWKNYWVSNDGVSPGANGMIVTNMSFDTPPKEIIDRAGIHEDEVNLTPSNSMSARTPLKNYLHQGNCAGEFSIIDTRGRQVASFSSKGEINVVDISRKFRLPSGTYLIKHGNTILKKQRIIILN